jgi:hypothetical protein
MSLAKNSCMEKNDNIRITNKMKIKDNGKKKKKRDSNNTQRLSYNTLYVAEM